MPWIGSDAWIESKIKIAKLESELAAEQNRRERAELDLARLQDDFKGLVALTAGRIPPKLAPEFEKNPWAEDERLPEVFLTPALDELGIDSEEEQKDAN